MKRPQIHGADTPDEWSSDLATNIRFCPPPPPPIPRSFFSNSISILFFLLYLILFSQRSYFFSWASIVVLLLLIISLLLLQFSLTFPFTGSPSLVISLSPLSFQHFLLSCPFILPPPPLVITLYPLPCVLSSFLSFP